MHRFSDPAGSADGSRKRRRRRCLPRCRTALAPRTRSLIHFSGPVSSRRHPPDLESCGAVLRRLATHEGLTTSDLLQLLSDAPPSEREALRQLLDGAGDAPDRRATAAALEHLEELLGVDLGSATMRGPWHVVGRRLGHLVGLVVGPLCGYIVVGGLIEGDSLLLGNTVGGVGLGLLIVLLALLGLYEALHTSATQLKIADLGAVAERYPRAATLHRRFRTDSGLSRFLAGRRWW